MLKCYLVPMTDPPYSREMPQQPRYLDDLNMSWTGSPLFKAHAYVVKVSGTPEQHAVLQASEGVLDFPNNDSDRVDELPAPRKGKDAQIRSVLKIPESRNETVKDFINRAAQSEGNTSWDKDAVYCGE